MECKLWMDTGRNDNNTRKYINITNLAASLGKDKCNAIIALHAFTGCDFTAAFSGKGKVRPYKLMCKKTEYVKAFCKLGEQHPVPQSVCDDIERFACAMYAHPKLESINKVRVEVFKKKCAPKDQSKPMSDIKNMDASLIPPCKESLRHKIMRTNYVASVWKRANTANTMVTDTTESGWELEGTYRLIWFTGDQMPNELQMIVAESNEGEEDEESDFNYESDSDSSVNESDDE